MLPLVPFAAIGFEEGGKLESLREASSICGMAVDWRRSWHPFRVRIFGIGSGGLARSSRDHRLQAGTPSVSLIWTGGGLDECGRVAPGCVPHGCRPNGLAIGGSRFFGSSDGPGFVCPRGASCIAEGASCIADGAPCSAEGSSCNAEGAPYIAEGASCIAEGASCIAEGSSCNAEGVSCIAEGASCITVVGSF
jgi:hypothetical protein